MAKCVARIEYSVTNKLEQAAVKLVGSRLGHHADQAGGMLAVPRRHRAGFELEFLQRIRKRQTDKMSVAERIVVRPAVQGK